MVIRNGNVLALATNKFRNHPNINHLHATYHAERAATRGLSPQLMAGATIYVARVNRRGEPRLAKPCDACWQYLVYCGIKKVVYTTNCGGYSVEKLLDTRLTTC